MKAKRLVTIEMVLGTWVVLYADRAKGQWHSAAQFYAKDNSRSKVEKWVMDNPKLELVGEKS